MASKEFDLIVIGSGPGGTTAATSAVKAGHRVALLEAHRIGGTCLNYGCDPTKTLLHTAMLLHQATHARPFGLQIPEATADWTRVLERVRQVQTKMRGGTQQQAIQQLEQEGLTVFEGRAGFISPHEIKVGDQTLRGERFVIATGTRASVPDVEGLHEAGFLTNVEAVELPRLPRRMVIVGGGPNGIEFGQMFTRFGVEVTVLESGPDLLDPEDREIAAKLIERLRREKIRFETGCRLERVQVTPQGQRLFLRQGQGQDKSSPEITLETDQILIVAGRQPNLQDLNLERAGVKYNPKGIEVDPTLRTNVAHIWAAGDITGGYQFTHLAEAQGELAAANAFADLPKPFDEPALSWVTFTDPELAHLGQTEEQLKEAKVKYRVLRQDLSDTPRFVATGENAGEIKLLVDEQGYILGAHILAAAAGELIAPLVLAMRRHIAARELAQMVFAYPTRMESLKQVAGQL